MRKRTQAREFSLQILYQRELNPEPIDEIFLSFWADHAGVQAETRSFAELLARGTCENLEEIDGLIQKAADNWQLSRMAVVDRNILRFAVYELLFVEEVPPKVTINEAVNMAKKFSQEDSGKFVNGVLDKINHTEKTRYPDVPKSSD